MLFLSAKARMAELVDALVSNTCGKPCRFDSGSGYLKALLRKGFFCVNLSFRGTRNLFLAIQLIPKYTCHSEARRNLFLSIQLILNFHSEERRNLFLTFQSIPTYTCHSEARGISFIPSNLLRRTPFIPITTTSSQSAHSYSESVPFYL